MVLLVGENLEAIVNREDEFIVAIEALRSRSFELVNKVKEVEQSDSDAKMIDVFSPVVEQSLDPVSFDNPVYSINVGYDSSSYDSSKYYDLVSDGETVGASMSQIASAYEHKFLREAQDAAQDMKSAKDENKCYVDHILNMDSANVRIGMKTYSEAVWRLMYDGKLIFN